MTKTRGFLLLVVALIGVGVAYAALSKPPQGEAGPAADALAREIEAAIDKPAWDRTGAVTWVFAGRNRHLWDRARNLSRVSWGSGDDELVVLFDIGDQSRAIVTRGGKAVTGDERTKPVQDAYAKWINDSFWLNPVAKLFDPGTVRQLLPEIDGQRRLLLTYTSGGLTPGDSYLYTLGTDSLPIRWEMWVQIIPVGGVEASFENWITLSTGAKVSTRHALLVKQLELTEVRGAATVQELVGSDPFAALVGNTGR